MLDRRSLSVAEIASAMETFRGAAAELIDDAASLERSNRLARSFSLYFCAAEELAKFYTLEVAGRKLAQGGSPDWPDFWRKLRGHDARIVETHVRMRRAAGAAEPARNTLELSGLGAALINGSASAPGPDWEISRSATRALARRLLADADTFGETARDIESALSEACRKDRLATFVNAVVHALEHAGDPGCAKQNIIRYLDKIGVATDF